MTADANPLTSRATDEWPPAPPMVESGCVRPLVDAFERLGYDRMGLIQAAGLDERRLADPDATLPCTAFGEMIAHATRARPRPNLALQLARVTPIGAFPLIDYLILSCDTVGEGLVRLARYYRLVAAGAQIELSQAHDGMRVHPVHGGGAFQDEYGISLSLLHLGRESDGRARASFVSFAHQPDDVVEFESAFGCPVRVRAGWSGYVLTKETWALPMRGRDAALLSHLEERADERLAAFISPSDIVSRVRRVISHELAEGHASMGEVARELAMTTRTLQRRLAEHSTTFQRVTEEARRESAQRLLAGARLSIAEISYALGYSEPAAFHRAFRRWTSTTPQEYRARAGRA
jgi:AraC-like DNA-binding protein